MHAPSACMQKHSTEIADQLELAGKYTHCLTYESQIDYYSPPLEFADKLGQAIPAFRVQ